jgi:hypothetical protein
LFCFVIETGYLYTAQGRRNSPSRVLGLKLYATMPDCKFINYSKT